MSTVSLCFFWECEGINESTSFDLNDNQDNDDLASPEEEPATV